MGLLSKVLERFGRQRGMLADDQHDPSETVRLPRPIPTRGTHIPKRPHATPTTERMGRVGETAGTPSYRSPGGTPSTQRIHNPSHPGR